MIHVGDLYSSFVTKFVEDAPLESLYSVY